MNFQPLIEFMNQLDDVRTVGHVIEVRLAGQKVFEYACGYSDLENKIPMTGEALFGIYSASKLTTVTAGYCIVQGFLPMKCPV